MDRAREAVAVLRGTIPDHWRTRWSEGVLGAALGGLGRFEEAEPLLAGAPEAVAGARGADAPATLDALRRMVAFYDAWGRSAQADAYRARLEAARKQ